MTITGTGFSGTPEVIIDGISCTVSASTSTSITCTTGDKGASNTAKPSLVVKVNG